MTRKKQKKSTFFISTKVIVLANVALLVMLLALIFFSLPKVAGKDNSKQIEADAQEAVDECKTVPDWRSCYGFALSVYLKRESLEYSFKVLNRVEDIDSKTQSCHVISHKLAAAEMEKDPSKWGELVKRVDSNFCNYGFIHGVIEARSRFEPDFAINPKSIGEICEIITTGSRIRGADQSCAHIMGHVLLADKEGDIAESVDVCNKSKQSLQFECNSGIFMENFTRDNLVAHGVAEYVPWNDDIIQKQENLCRKYKDTISAKGCWMETSHLYNNKYPNQPKKVYEECSKSPSLEFTNTCYKHAVATLLENPHSDNTYLRSLCGIYDDKPGEYPECASIVIGSYINSSLKLTDKAFDYCSLAPDRFKSYCYQRIGKLLGMHVSKGMVISYCSKAPIAYLKDCENPGVNI